MVIYIELYLTSAFALFLFIAVLSDVKVHRIPNVVLIFLLALDAASEIFSYSSIDSNAELAGLFQRYLSVLFIFIFLFVFFSIGGIGAGDLKTLVLTLVYVKSPLTFTLTVFALALVFGLIKLICNRNLISRLDILRKYVTKVLIQKRPVPYFDTVLPAEERKYYSIHLSIPIFLAFCAFVFLEGRVM